MTATCTTCELHAESTFKIEGMNCREEVAILERRFRNLAGLEGFSADPMGQRLHVTYDAAKLSTATIVDAVADTGMRIWLEHEKPTGVERQTRTREALVALCGVALVVGLLTGSMHGAPLLVRACFVVSLVIGIGLTVREATKAMLARSLDIQVLMLIAVVGAVALGEWSEAATVVFLFAVAQAIESRTMDRARLAIRALMKLTPSEALVRDGNDERRVSVDTVRPGAVIIIRPGEKIPLDGAVLSGESAVNQAPVTGESLPIDKAPGDEVFAGTVNGRGALDVRVTRLRRDTTLAKIVHLVERAQAERAPAQRLVERFAQVYTPTVIALAFIVAIVPPLAFGYNWHLSLYRGLVLLVVSCPCALVISTPVSVVAALAAAAKKGVLIKGGVHLERAGAVRCVAFDKTGTLTCGTPKVVDVIALSGLDRNAIVALAAAVERRSTHPIARAILQHAEASHLVVTSAVGVSSLAGRGAEGSVGGATVLLGNHRLFEERCLCSPALHDRLAQLSADGNTLALVARDDEAVGIIVIADRPREAARETIDLLRDHGVASVVMLTGDGRGTALALAKELGVDEFQAELLPEDKVKAVNELRRRFGSVAVVGDGVNDAPAMASADVGIAMGAAGSDAALETADIALMADELLKIPFALRLSRATVRNIRTNLGISLAMKAAFVMAAVAGVATLWMAILADTGASVIVIANALTLLREN